MIHSIYEYQGLKIFYRDGTEDENVIGHSFDNDIFYREIPQFKPSPDPTIIDVGAHIGTFSILSSLKIPEARVFAIEASEESYRVLEKNVTENGLSNIEAIHAAASPVNEKIKLFHSAETGNWGHSITTQLSNSFEEVDGITISQIIENYNLDKIDLIKFNCEGAEFDILMKLNEASLLRIGCGIVLYHEDLNMNYKIQDLADRLRSCGFHTKIIFRNNDKGRGWLIMYNGRYYSHLGMFISKIRKKLSW